MPALPKAPPGLGKPPAPQGQDQNGGPDPNPAAADALMPPNAKPQKVTIDDVMELLRDDLMRGFRIDVETDQMVQADEIAEKVQALQFATQVGGLLQGAMQIQASPLAGALLPAVGETLMFVVRRYKAGRALEQVFEQALEKAAMLASQPQGGPGEDAKHQAEQVKLEAVKIKAAAEGQKAQAAIATQHAQTENDMMRLAGEQQRDQQKAALEAQLMQAKANMKAMELQMEERRMHMEAMAEAHRHALQRQQAEHQAMLSQVMGVQQSAPASNPGPDAPFGA
jgi:hypothetical protein